MTKNAATRLNEASEVTIPLRNLISMIAFTLAVYPIMRPLIGSAFGLAALVPAWQSEMSTLRQQAEEYRASAEAERAALSAAITGLEQTIETALSAQQSSNETLLEIQSEIAAYRARLEILEAHPIVSDLVPQPSDTVPERAPQDSGAPQQLEQQNQSIWPGWSLRWADGWKDSWSLSGIFGHIAEMLSLRRVDGAPSS